MPASDAVDHLVVLFPTLAHCHHCAADLRTLAERDLEKGWRKKRSCSLKKEVAMMLHMSAGCVHICQTCSNTLFHIT